MAIPMIVYLWDMSGSLYYSARYLPPHWYDKMPNGGPFDDIRAYDPAAAETLLMPYSVIAATGTNLQHYDFLTLWTGPRFVPAGEAALFIGTIPFAIALVGIVFGKHPAKRIWLTLLAGMALLGLGKDGGLHNLLYYVMPPLWIVRHTHALAPFILLALIFFFALGLQTLLRSLRPKDIESRMDLIASWSRPWLVEVFGNGVKTRWTALEGWMAIASVVATVIGVYWLSQNVGWVLFATMVLAVPVGFAVFQWAFGGKGSGPSGISVWLGIPFLVLVWAIYNIALPSDAFDTWRRPAILVLAGSLLTFVAIRFGHWGRILAAVAIASVLITLLAAKDHQTLLAYYGVFLLLPLIIVTALWMNAASRISMLFLILVTAGMQLITEFVHSDVWVGTPPAGVKIQSGEIARLLPRELVAYPPKVALDASLQPMRYLEVLRKVPTALDPLHSYAARRESLEGMRFSDVPKEGMWNSFVYYRSYAELVFSGLDDAILTKVFAIGEEPLQFRTGWVSAPDFVQYMRQIGPIRGAELLKNTVVLSEPVTMRQESGGPAKSTIRVIKYRYDALTAEVTTDRRGLLYFADGYDANWKARIDGSVVPVLRANGNFKAVALPEGKSTVTFQYSPTLFASATMVFQAIFVLGVLALMLSYGIDIVRGYRRA
ncbi:MAG: hypothetical protein EXR96_09685 [Nitrospiraceae bacterium]|nr:hypothetical protein [Nitrospiraceae bacterium]